MITKKEDATADPMADNRSMYDHKAGVLNEPNLDDEPKVLRHQVDPKQNIELEEGEDPNGPIPRRGDPFAHQRDAKAAEAGAKKEAAEQKTAKKEDEK